MPIVCLSDELDVPSFPARVNRAEHCPAWRFPLSGPSLINLLHGKTFKVPEGGWNANTFVREGRGLISTIHRLAKVTQRKAIPPLAASIARVLNRQMDRVIQQVRTRRPGSKSDDAVLLNVDEAVWMQAIDDVFRDAGLDVTLEIVPPLHSVMAQAYARVDTMLGQKPNVDTNARLAQQAREIAQKITRVNDTTKRQLENAVRRSIGEGLTVAETAAALRQKMPEINANRSLTIARTELNNAWTQGTAAAYQESTTLSTLAVIGCEGREENSPKWKGESTCNYPSILITEMEAFLAVGWHVNHTGNLVPSGFRD